MYRSEYMHTYFYKNQLRDYMKSYYYNTALQVEREKSFFTQSHCREAITKILTSVALASDDYKFIIDILPKDRGGLPVYQKISDVFKMDLSFLPVEDRMIIFGNTKSFQNFNFGISFLLYVMKYMRQTSWLLNKKQVSTTKLSSTSYSDNVEVPTGFLWYLAYVENLGDFVAPINDTNVQRQNGVARFFWSGLFTLHPDLFSSFRRYVKSLKGGMSFVSGYSESYVNIGDKRERLGRLICSE